MINLEGLSVSIIKKMFNGQAIEQERKQKMAYGLSVLLGLFIEFSVCVIISLFLQTTKFLIPIMLSALFLRMFTGGKHCTSYNRCLLFTSAYFLPLSWLVKYIYHLNGVILLHYSTHLFFIIAALLAKRNMRDKHFWFMVGKIIHLLIGNLFCQIQPWLLLSISFGLTSQALILSVPGSRIISCFDYFFKKIGI